MSTLLQHLEEELPTLFSLDGSKEIGIAAIFTWFHAISRLCERYPQYAPLPPVLISTLSVLGGLGLLRGAAGKEATQQIVAYFDPSVQFLGNYMSLWLVPPLVLVPKAIERIPNRCTSLWIKLILVHFTLWAASVGGMTILVKLLEGGSDGAGGVSGLWARLRQALSEWRAGSANAASDREAVEASGATAVVDATPGSPSRANTLSPSRTAFAWPYDQTSPSTSSNGVKPNRNGVAASLPSSSSSSSRRTQTQTQTQTQTDQQQEQQQGWAALSPDMQAKLKVIRFWGVVSASFYAAAAAHKHIPAVRALPIYPFLATYTPALTTTAITVYSSGMALPPQLKKIGLHPLILTAAASGVIVMLLGGDGSQNLELIEAGAGGPLGGATGSAAAALTGGRWEPLHGFTSASRPASSGLLNALKAGDFLSLFLGPSCTALAFRIYATLSKQSEQGDLRGIKIALITSLVQAITSLTLSPALGRLAGLPVELNMMLSHRTVTSALAIPAAQATGASPELTTASVLVTGLYGASGAWLYDLLGLGENGSAGSNRGGAAGRSAGDNGPNSNSNSNTSSTPESNTSTDSTASNTLTNARNASLGAVVGSTSHTIGTSELVSSQPSAAGTASIAMFVTGLVHAALCAAPGAREVLFHLACGGRHFA